MKKEYTAPQAEITKFQFEDCMAASPGFIQKETEDLDDIFN